MEHSEETQMAAKCGTHLAQIWPTCAPIGNSHLQACDKPGGAFPRTIVANSVGSNAVAPCQPPMVLSNAPQGTSKLQVSGKPHNERAPWHHFL